MEKKQYRSGFDYTLLIVVFFLIVFGLMMIYSTSAYTSMIKHGKSTYFLDKQLKNLAFAAVAFLVGLFIDYHLWYKGGWFWFILGIIVPMLVLIPQLRVNVNGADRWLKIGPFSFQPGEVSKVCLIMFLSIMICRIGVKQINDIRFLAYFLFLAVMVAGIIFVFNDNLSTAIICVGIAAVMLFVANNKYAPFVALGVVAAVVVLLAVYVATHSSGDQGFRLTRILVWLNPEKYAKEEGFQVVQGLYAIGSGGIFGKGFGNSIQKLGYVPEAENDMIFSIICEELGLFGAFCVIAAFIILISRFIVVAANSKDMLGAMIVVGVMAQIAIQTVLNIAVVTNSIPNTGVTLPFISYGGSSVCILMFEIGVVLNVSGQIKVKV